MSVNPGIEEKTEEKTEEKFVASPIESDLKEETKEPASDLAEKWMAMVVAYIGESNCPQESRRSLKGIFPFLEISTAGTPQLSAEEREKREADLEARRQEKLEGKGFLLRRKREVSSEESEQATKRRKISVHSPSEQSEQSQSSGGRSSFMH